MLERIFYSMELTVVGMSSVFAVLYFFFLVIWFMKFVDARITAKKSEQISPEIESEITQSEENEGELIAVISAAVQATFGKKANIKRIQFLDPQMQEGKWASAGRLNVMSSHNLNKRN